MLGAILFYGCNSDMQERNESDLSFASEDLIVKSGSVVSESSLPAFGNNKVTQFVKNGSKYLFLTNTSDFRFYYYNSETGDKVAYVPVGDKIGEGMYFINLQICGSIASSFDFANNRMVKFDLNKCEEEGYSPEFVQLAGSTLNCINVNGKFLSTGIYLKDKYGLSAATSPKDIKYNVSYPVNDNISLSKTLSGILYASNHLVCNSSEDKIACANMQTGLLDICEIEGADVNLVNRVKLTTPEVKINKVKSKKKSVHPIAYKRENKMAFISLTSSDKYIYALYSGKLCIKGQNTGSSKNIIVFDWEGHILSINQLGNEYVSLAYDSDKDELFGLTRENGKNSIREIYNIAL